MSNVLRLAIVDPNDSQREALKNLLLGMDMIWLEAECSRYEFFADVVAQTNPDIGLVAIGADPQKALDLVSRLATSSPDCSILVVSSSNDGSLILQALRAGAKEFLTQPLQLEDLLGALGRIGERRFGRTGENRPRGSQVIAVAGAIGGVGTTSLAINLGCASWPKIRKTPWPWSISICAWATPTCFSTPFPTTRWSTWPKTSRGWISPC